MVNRRSTISGAIVEIQQLAIPVPKGIQNYIVNTAIETLEGLRFFLDMSFTDYDQNNGTYHRTAVRRAGFESYVHSIMTSSYSVAVRFVGET